MTQPDFHNTTPIVITKYNVPENCCCHEYCNTKATFYVIITLRGLPLHIMLCNKHAIQWLGETQP